jgi:hypothetical protein
MMMMLMIIIIIIICDRQNRERTPKTEKREPAVK